MIGFMKDLIYFRMIDCDEIKYGKAERKFIHL